MARRRPQARGKKAKRSPKSQRTRRGAGRQKAKPATRRRARAPKSAKRPKAKPARAVKAARAAKPKAAKPKTAKVKTAKPTPAKPSRVASPRKPAKTAQAPGARSNRVVPSIPAKSPRLDRVRRTLEDTVQTPPSSLDMDRHGSAVRTGRAEMEESRRDHQTMTPGITSGDVDVNIENAYFSGDETPGGDNQTPDQDIVDDIGRALGVEYQDNEELRSGDKVGARDRHRWELDPASAEDFKERK